MRRFFKSPTPAEQMRSFWRGTTPRLGRLVISGALVFSIYESVITSLGGRSI